MHGMPADDRTESSFLPEGRFGQQGHKTSRGKDSPSSIGLESTTMTEKTLPRSNASKSIFSTTDDLSSATSARHCRGLHNM